MEMEVGNIPGGEEGGVNVKVKMQVLWPQTWV